MNEQMHTGAAEGDLQRLAARLEHDPGAAPFPALAELHRRSGDPRAAERVARAGLERRPDALAGRVALGLALLDLGRTDEARAELERVLASVPDHPLAAEALERSGAGAAPDAARTAPDDDDVTELDEPLDDADIDDAFAGARAEPREPVTPESVAQDALLAAEAEGEGDDDARDAEDDEAMPVATRTVADLLERQGHADRARAMRADLEARTPRAGADIGSDTGADGEPRARRRGDPGRDRILATLERWLDNLRGGRR